jgi:hypothetical protein
MGDILRRGTRDKPPIIGPLRSVTLIRSEFVVMLCRAMRPLSVKTTRSADRATAFRSPSTAASPDGRRR